MDKSNFKFQKTGLDGLILISPFYSSDQRGGLTKSFEKEIFAAEGIDFCPFEEVRSRSRAGVLRGLHFQREHSQNKLVQVICGAVYDVAVDLRKGSSTFGKWEAFRLSEENRLMLYIPKGFAHGFLALRDGTLLNYLLGSRYDPQSDGGIRWDDPQLAVDWPLDQVEKVVLSEKDAAFPTLGEFLDRYGALSGGGGA